MKTATLIVIMSSLLSTTMFTPAFASSGKAFIPMIHARVASTDNRVNCHTSLSNISNETVDITITYYNASGTVIVDGDGSTSTGPIRVVSGAVTNYVENPASGSVEFSLGANETAVVMLKSDSDGSSFTIGYGTIEWEKNSVNGVALISQVFIDEFIRDSQKSSHGYYAIPVNNGLPF